MSEDEEDLAESPRASVIEVAGATEGLLRERLTNAGGGWGPYASIVARAGSAIAASAFALQRPEVEELGGSPDDTLTSTAWTAVVEGPPTGSDRELTATHLVFAALRVRHRLLDDWEPDIERGERLDGDVYTRFFSRSIVPDMRNRFLLRSGEGKHVIVLVRGRAFRIDVVRAGKVVTAEALLTALQRCVAMAETTQPAPCAMTAATYRELFAEYRSRATLQDDMTSLRTIGDALFIVCLDDAAPEGDAEGAFLAHAGNAANRWHLQALQFVVFANAKVAAVGSFMAGLEGQPAARVLGAIAGELGKRWRPVAGAEPPATCRALHWSGAPYAPPSTTRYAAEPMIQAAFGHADARAMGVSSAFGFHLFLMASVARARGELPRGKIIQLVNRRHLRGGRLGAQELRSTEAMAFIRAFTEGRGANELRALAATAQERYVRDVQEVKMEATRVDIADAGVTALRGQTVRRLVRRALRSLPQEPELFRLSLLSLPPGVRVVGRSGVKPLAPTAIWAHPYLEESSLRLVAIFGDAAVLDAAALTRAFGSCAAEWRARVASCQT